MDEGSVHTINPITAVKLTHNVERNLANIEAFLLETKAPGAFDALLDELTETVIPNLTRFPALGHPFLTRRTGSVETLNGANGLTRKWQALSQDTRLREYIFSEYLLLYGQIGSTLYLLSLRHQRQLSFDFQALWRMK